MSETTVESPAVRVARGAAKLDESRPGWASEVRGAMVAGDFNMHSWDTCIAGTLEIFQWGGEGNFVPVISFNGTVLTGQVEAAEYGFVGTIAEEDTLGSDALDDLEDYWRAEIAARTDRWVR